MSIYSQGLVLPAVAGCVLFLCTEEKASPSCRTIWSVYLVPFIQTPHCIFDRSFHMLDLA